MKLYATDRVEKIESTDEFQQAKAKANKHKPAASKAVETKLAKMSAWVDDLEIEIPTIPMPTLIREACENHNAIFAGHSYASETDDAPFLHKICVNYLRHRCSKYEQLLTETHGKAGVNEACVEIKEKVLNAIAEAYPDLAKECDNQQKKAAQNLG